MKIIFLESAVNYGGASIATISMAKRIAQIEGYEVSIVDVNGSCLPFVEACKQANVDMTILSPSSKTAILGSNNIILRIKNYISFVPMFIKVRKLLKKHLIEHKPDYVCVNSQRTLSYLYGNKVGSQVIYFVHYWSLPSQISKTLKFLFKKVVDKFLCVSQATRHAVYAARIAPLENIFVVPNAIDVNNVPQKIANIPDRDGKIVILQAAGFTKGKNQLLSVEIARKLKARGIKFKMILAGLIYKNGDSAEYFELVRSKISKYGLEQDVLLVVNKTNVMEYFLASDILIHPSETEGFPLVVLEAMATRVLVIANPVGGIIDQVINGFTGFLPRHNNVDDYVSCIINLKNDPTLKTQITERAYEMVSTIYTESRQIDCFINSIK